MLTVVVCPTGGGMTGVTGITGGTETGGITSDSGHSWFWVISLAPCPLCLSFSLPERVQGGGFDRVLTVVVCTRVICR